MTQTLHKTDHQLKTAITDELVWAPNVDADHVGVSVIDGAVTLAGEVRSYPEKAAAVKATLRVQGVTAVADELVVKNNWGPRDDTDIAREASAALQGSVTLVKDTVQATVHQHQITLTGNVDWNYQRDAAAKAVASLPGVTGINNTIKLKPTLPFIEAEATSRITSALVRNAQIDAKQIHISASGSEIQLTGTVRSWAEYRQAGHAAWATPGVTHVTNHLTVGS